ncbi:MAG: menaquinone biosynthesis decarboxylase [Aquificota bacterium]|nr:MAG: menaquinone biosynthesis decarboxylase [Aquificota bacterium]
MAYRDLRDYMSKLEKLGELARIKVPVDPNLEITEIADRVVKKGGPALLFEKVKGSPFPLVINLFGTPKRMKLALGEDDLEEIGREMVDIIEPELPTSLVDKLKALPKLKKMADFIPKRVKTGPCKEVILKGDEVNLLELPATKCWPLDGGPFITLPLVFTKDPETGTRNCGMYRMQVFDEKTTGMHWHVHKDGARHYLKAERRGEPLEVAVTLGCDPATIYAATAPLPPDMDEMLFAGFLRKAPVEMVKCETVDLEVPARAEFVLEGYVKPGERRTEGPFGDHTGYYSMPDLYPVFHVTCITRRKEPIYPSTIVGKPPMEDCYIGKATERIFLPLMKKQLPEIVDMNLPVEGVFHNLAIVSIDKQYPGHARKVINALWGMGQMMFTKMIIVVDSWVNVHDWSEVVWRMGNNVDPARDVIITQGPVDVLNHASPLPNFGGKMGIDATKKWKEEGFEREWPPDIEMSQKIKELVNRRWKEYGL